MTPAGEKISECLAALGITYFGITDYKNMRVINTGLEKRVGFTPKSVIVFLVPYYAGDSENLSLYATSYDYHIILRSITDRLGRCLSELFPDCHSGGYGDHSPIDERYAALSLGLGILGDNGLIINREYGSYVFIGDMLTDIPPELLSQDETVEISRCEHCGKCSAACPTGILRGKGTDCLSAITQRRGELTPKEVALMKKYNTVWGCDICSRVCPHNSAPKLTPIGAFFENRITYLDSDSLSRLTDEEFSKRAFAWRGRKTVERNIRLVNE